MKKQKSIKLALISMLSNPDVKIEECSMENEITEINDSEFPLINVYYDTPIIKMISGRTFYKLTIFKYDDSTTKTKTGKAKGTKATNRKIPNLAYDRDFTM